MSAKGGEHAPDRVIHGRKHRAERAAALILDARELRRILFRSFERGVHDVEREVQKVKNFVCAAQ